MLLYRNVCTPENRVPIHFRFPAIGMAIVIVFSVSCSKPSATVQPLASSSTTAVVATGNKLEDPLTAVAEVDSKDAGWGHLTGKIVVVGDVNSPRKLNPDKDAAVCLKDGNELYDETVVVGENGGLSDAFVMIYIGRGDDPPEVHSSYEEKIKDKVVVDNDRCRFEPHAAFVRTGQTLVMKNSDSVGHNVHTLNKDEKNKNVPAGGEVEVTYEEADKIPADIECNIHTWMKGVLLVREDPYVSITNKDGEFSIENIPAGKWKFQFWHKKTGYLKMLTKDGEEFLGRRGEFEIEIEDGETVDLGELRLQADVLNEAD